jgi:hypothetical protein
VKIRRNAGRLPLVEGRFLGLKQRFGLVVRLTALWRGTPGLGRSRRGLRGRRFFFLGLARETGGSQCRFLERNFFLEGGPILLGRYVAGQLFVDGLGLFGVRGFGVFDGVIPGRVPVVFGLERDFRIIGQLGRFFLGLGLGFGRRLAVRRV